MPVTRSRYRIRGEKAFECPLQCAQCVGRTKAGTQCRRRSCIGTPHCWQHLLADKHLRILPSTIEGAGEGAVCAVSHGRCQ